MRGSLFKRCIDCGRVVQNKRCGSCGSRRYNWGYAVDIGTYADGRRRQQRRTGFDTAEEASERCATWCRPLTSRVSSSPRS